MECLLNGRLIKLEEDGEVYYWFDYCGGRLLKNPYWRKYKQTIATYKRGRQYKVIASFGRHFLIHRVIYFIHNQEWDIYDSSLSNLIDHIDRDTFNNNIENLRPATHQQNCFNTKSKNYQLTKNNTYRTGISAGETKLYKNFKTEQEAIDAVAEFRLKYHQF